VARLVSSGDTVEHFVSNIYEKPGLKNILYWFDWTTVYFLFQGFMSYV